MAALVTAATPGTVEVLKSVGKKGGKRGEMELRPIMMKRACPGVEGAPCAKGAYLKKNSTGSICGYCREHILSMHQSVSAKLAKSAINKISRSGTGTRFVAEVLSLSRSNLLKIKSGDRKRVAPEVEAALVDMAEGLSNMDADTCCSECGLSHAKPDRLRRLARLLPATTKDVIEAYPCTYKLTSYTRGYGENRTLPRDMHALGAEYVNGMWEIRRHQNESRNIERAVGAGN